MNSVIKHPLTTEKAVKLMESENKLLFAVALKSTKKQIKEDVERLFKVKVIGVNTLITSDGEKRAYVKLATETPAMDVVTQLGLM